MSTSDTPRQLEALIPQITIVGGGITGLAAAKYFLDSGYEVHLYEAEDRLGGKIESAAVAGITVNAGAEFIDSTHTFMRGLCKELGLNKIETPDQKTRRFHLPATAMGGESFMDAGSFFLEAKPIYDIIRNDKRLISLAQKNGTLYDNPIAQKLDKLSLTAYMQWVKERLVEKKPELDTPRTTQLIDAIIGAYVADNGRDAKVTSALQYVNESSAKRGDLVGSDCGFRVEGGTQQIIDKLEKTLTENSKFYLHKGTRITSVHEYTPSGQPDSLYTSARQPDSFYELNCEGRKTGKVWSNYVIFALPAPALAKIEGLKTITGLTQEGINLLKDLQYTQVTKFSVKIRDGLPPEKHPPRETLFSHTGFECWSPAPNVMTFLIGSGQLHKHKKDLVKFCIDTYAHSLGIRSGEEIFDTSKIAIANANPEKPCHAAAKPGQFIPCIKLVKETEKLAERGIGIIGTYLPFERDGYQIGFAEAGVRSAHAISTIIDGQIKQRQGKIIDYEQILEQAHKQSQRSLV